MQEILADADAAGMVGWNVLVDATICRAHHHGRNTARPEQDTGARSNSANRPVAECEPAGHGIGRTRGGLTTKPHSAVDGRGRPLADVVTGGRRNDGAMLEQALTDIHAPRHRRGRPRTRPDSVIADKAYSEHRRRHPGEKRHDRRPGTPRQPRGPAPETRCRPGQRPKRRRTILRPDQAMARPVHPLRPTRNHLPRRRHPLRHHDLGTGHGVEPYVCLRRSLNCTLWSSGPTTVAYVPHGSSTGSETSAPRECRTSMVVATSLLANVRFAPSPGARPHAAAANRTMAVCAPAGRTSSQRAPPPMSASVMTSNPRTSR